MAINILGNREDNELIGEYEQAEGATINFRGKRSRLTIGKNVQCFKFHINIFDDCKVEISDDCRLSGTFTLRDDCTVKIGQRTWCNSHLNISAAEGTMVILGADCLISSATIRSSDMHPVFCLDTGERVNPAKDVIVGDHVWFGQESFITKGVSIGAGCVIAARAVVTKSIPSNCAVAGNPAKIIRERIRWDRRL
jgi:acetyltransferase-like isoleucine patch superfamily enzyme